MKNLTAADVMSTPVLTAQDDWDLERLARHSRQIEMGAGETIFRKFDAGDSMYVVVTGRVVIYSQSTDGREVVFNIINPGEVFGEIAFY